MATSGFRLVTLLFLVGLFVYTTHTANDDTTSTTTIIPPNDNPTSTTTIIPPGDNSTATATITPPNDNSTATSTIAPPNDNSTVTSTSAPLPLKASNCTEGLPFACFISPVYQEQYGKRCTCMENTTFIYNNTACKHRDEFYTQQYDGPEDFEVTIRCNYTLSKCFQTEATTPAYKRVKLMRVSTTTTTPAPEKPDAPPNQGRFKREDDQDDDDAGPMEENDVMESLAGKGFLIGQSDSCWISWEPNRYVRNVTGLKDFLNGTAKTPDGTEKTIKTANGTELTAGEVSYPVPQNEQVRERCNAVKHIIHPDRKFKWLGEAYTKFIVLQCFLEFCGRRNELPKVEGYKFREQLCIPRAPDPFSLTWSRKWCDKYEQNRSVIWQPDGNTTGCEPLPPCEPDAYTDRDYLPAVIANFTQDYLKCEMLCAPGLSNLEGKDGWGRPCRRLPAAGFNYFALNPKFERPLCDPDTREIDSLRKDPPRDCIPYPLCDKNGTVPNDTVANPFYLDDCVFPMDDCTERMNKIFHCNQSTLYVPDEDERRALAEGTPVQITEKTTTKAPETSKKFSELEIAMIFLGSILSICCCLGTFTGIAALLLVLAKKKLTPKIVSSSRKVPNTPTTPLKPETGVDGQTTK